jgi:hypothetical protein
MHKLIIRTINILLALILASCSEVLKEEYLQPEDIGTAWQKVGTEFSYDTLSCFQFTHSGFSITISGIPLTGNHSGGYPDGTDPASMGPPFIPFIPMHTWGRLENDNLRIDITISTGEDSVHADFSNTELHWRDTLFCPDSLAKWDAQFLKEYKMNFAKDRGKYLHPWADYLHPVPGSQTFGREERGDFSIFFRPLAGDLQFFEINFGKFQIGNSSINIPPLRFTKISNKQYLPLVCRYGV